MHSKGNLKKLANVPVARLFPNMITILGLCIGTSAIRYALEQDWQMACLLVVIAAFLDAIDGRIATLLNSTSNFGAQLDSISDIINFGIVPVMILYMWELNHISVRGIGWFLVLFYLTCAAVRLARFNSKIDISGESIENAKGFFSGVPVTCAAILVLLPLLYSFEIAPGYKPNHVILALYIMAIGLVMVSSIPTFSFKKVYINHIYVSAVLLCVGILFTAILIRPWTVIPMLSVLYLILIPASAYISYKKSKNK